MADGRVVVLNGGSSAGKSSLAHELQRLWAGDGDCWIIVGWDDFVPRLPSRWIGLPGAVGDLARDGAQYERSEDGATFVLGEMGRRVLRAYHRTVRAFAEAGVNVIVDEVLLTPDDWSDWQEALAAVDTTWVEVACSPAVASEREAARGDRLPGLARGTGARVHLSPIYDATIDTSSTPPDVAAQELSRQLHRDPTARDRDSTVP